MSVQIERTAPKPIASLADLKELLAPLTQIPPYAEKPEFYQDWGEQGEFKVKVGRGECAV